MSDELPGGGRGLVDELGGRRNLLIAAAVGVAGLAWLMSRRAGSSTGTTTTDQTLYDGSTVDTVDQLQQQIDALNNAIQDGKVTPSQPGTGSTGGTPAPPSPPGKPPVGKPKPTKTPLPVTVHRPLPVKRPAVSTPKSASHKTVTVEHDQTLSGIAAANHITMATLRKLNPVYWTNPKYKQGNEIWAGDKVKVS